MPDAWDAVLDELRDRHPFLRRMTIAQDGELAYAEPLPGAVQIAIAIAATMRSLDAPENRAAIVFPRTHDTAAWIAIGTALVAVQRDWRERLQDPLPFRPGQKLYLDDRTSVVVEFDSPPA